MDIFKRNCVGSYVVMKTVCVITGVDIWVDGGSVAGKKYTK